MEYFTVQQLNLISQNVTNLKYQDNLTYFVPQLAMKTKKFYKIDSKKVTHLKAFSNFLDFEDFLEIITYADVIKLFYAQ